MVFAGSQLSAYWPIGQLSKKAWQLLLRVPHWPHLHRSAAIAIPRPLSESNLTNNVFRLSPEKALCCARGPKNCSLPWDISWSSLPAQISLVEGFYRKPVQTPGWCSAGWGVCFHSQILQVVLSEQDDIFWTCSKNGWLIYVTCLGIVVLYYRKVLDFFFPELHKMKGF